MFNRVVVVVRVIHTLDLLSGLHVSSASRNSMVVAYDLIVTIALVIELSNNMYFDECWFMATVRCLSSAVLGVIVVLFAEVWDSAIPWCAPLGGCEVSTSTVLTSGRENLKRLGTPWVAQAAKKR